MSGPVDELTLNGAMTLLSYLQHAHLSLATVKADAIAATLCEMLSQLESDFPGITREYGWEKIYELPERSLIPTTTKATHPVESDRNH